MDNIKCKKCGNINVKKNGYKIVENIKIQIYKCKKCNHQFKNKPGLIRLIKKTKNQK